MSLFELLIYEKEASFACITINRPTAMNALSNALVEEFDKAFDLVEEDKAVRALIITGAGEKAFMAGADIKELEARNLVLGRQQTKQRQHVFNRLAEMKIPVIAAINGFALGAGLELAVACTLRVASENARFGSPEVNLGIIPGDGATQRLPRLVGFGRAMEMVLTGDFMESQEAYRIGLINAVVPQAKLMATAKELALKLASKAPLAVQCAKEAVNRSLEVGLYEGLAHESYLHAFTCATEDKQEGVSAFLGKRKPNFQGR
jgi:enoyl-CoA hydratase